MKLGSALVRSLFLDYASDEGEVPIERVTDLWRELQTCHDFYEIPVSPVLERNIKQAFLDRANPNRGLSWVSFWGIYAKHMAEGAGLSETAFTQSGFQQSSGVG